MPRPKNGYRNLAGNKVPGVHDVTKRYADKGGLIHWAHQEGLKGNTDLYGKVTDIGHVVHSMAELDLRGASMRKIEYVPHETLSCPDDIDKAFQSFRAFQDWRKQHEVRAIAFEEAIVSEEWQYGGTFDCVAWVDGIRSLIDFKTCKTAGQVYLEQRIVMAAHGNLWHEAHANLPLAAYHLVNLPKDGSPPAHHGFASLAPEWEMFTLQLDCLRIEKGITTKRSVKRATAAPAPEAPASNVIRLTPAAGPAKAARKRSARPATVVPSPKSKLAAVAPAVPPAPPPAPPMSMAELLRSYGHVPEMA